MMDEDADLETLIKENEALQAENEALRREIGEHAVAFESNEEAIEPTGDEEATWLQARLEALKREREALENVLSLGEELQGLQRTNMLLREGTRHLEDENAMLRGEHAGLPAVGSRAMAPIAYAPSVKAAPRTAAPGPSPLVLAGQASVGPGKEVAEALRRGDSKALNDVSKEQRKELIADMLKTGLFVAPPGPLATSADDNAIAPIQERRIPVQSPYVQDAHIKKAPVAYDTNEIRTAKPAVAQKVYNAPPMSVPAAVASPQRTTHQPSAQGQPARNYKDTAALNHEDSLDDSNWDEARKQRRYERQAAIADKMKGLQRAQR